MGRPTAVFVASSDRLFADAAAGFFDRTSGWTCAGVAYDGIGALAALGRVAADALLATEHVGRLGSVPLAARVRARWPEMTIVVVGRTADARVRTVDPGASPSDVLAALRSPAGPAESAAPEPRARELTLLASLTKRERTVLRMVANGVSPATAADDLGLSAHTVRTHMQNLYEKLGCHSRLELVRFAERHGLIQAASEDA